MGLPRAQTLDASIAEGRRRLAGRYLNNPDAHVSTIRLEPGPSGQFQVIITLDYAPIHVGGGPPNMGLPRAQTLDASIAEGRRRLAGHYLNDPDAHVSTIRLELGPSGQLQVIITLEMAMT